MTIKTLPLLVLTATVLLLAACARDDDDRAPEIFTRRVSPADLPVPSCDDTTDDGKFGNWNSAEDHLMLVARTVVKPASTYVPGFISDIRLGRRRIFRDSATVEWNAQIDTGIDFHMSFSVVDRESGSLLALFDQPMRRGGTTPVRTSFRTPMTGGKLSPGCKRLYYCGYLVNQIPPLMVSSGQTPIDTMFLIYSGHFDVEIY